MRQRRTLCLAFAIAAVTTAIPVGSALATTHAEWAAQVNPICKDAARQAKKFPGQITKTPDPFINSLEIARLFARLEKKTIARIAAIPPAPDDEAAVTSWLDEGRLQVRLTHQLLRAVRHNNVRSARIIIRRTVKSQRRGHAKAVALGLPACAGKGSS